MQRTESVIGKKMELSWPTDEQEGTLLREWADDASRLAALNELKGRVGGEAEMGWGSVADDLNGDDDVAEAGIPSKAKKMRP